MKRLAALMALSALLLSGCTSPSVTEEPPAATTSPDATTESVTSTSTEQDTTERSTSADMTESVTEPMTEQAMPEAATEQVTGTTIVASGSEFGPMLFDGSGQAIYLFDKEKTSTSECYDACAAAWPPVLTDGAPAAGDGITASLLGTTARTDGSTQVTYNGHPLYFYDEPKWVVECHNVWGFGGLWLVVTPAGDAAAV